MQLKLYNDLAVFSCFLSIDLPGHRSDITRKIGKHDYDDCRNRLRVLVVCGCRVTPQKLLSGFLPSLGGVDKQTKGTTTKPEKQNKVPI